MIVRRRSAGDRIPVAGFVFVLKKKIMSIAHGPKNQKDGAIMILGEMIGIPPSVMESALSDLRQRMDSDPKFKIISDWLDTSPNIIYNLDYFKSN